MTAATSSSPISAWGVVGACSVSRAEFNRVAGVVVAGELAVPADATPFPWRIDVDDAVFALDLLRTIEPRRLVERTGRAGYDKVAAVRRALSHIT